MTGRLQRIADFFLFAFDTDMSRADRARWKTASSLADIGDLTVEWLHGGITQMPGHGGPPCEETIPHLEVLAAANRAGFVTTNSQSASSPEQAARHGAPWEAWADGLVSDNALQRIRAAVIGTPLLLAGARGRQRFGEARWPGMRGAWRDEVSFYEARCPDAASEIRAAWLITITDPEPGTNARLWPMLAAFAGATTACPSCSYCNGGTS